MRRSSLLCLGMLAVFSASAFADEATLQPDVIVTATRVTQTVDDTLADVSVITRAQIEASATRDISDLLRLQAGVDIARTGGPGGQTSVFLRGTNNNHVLVLIDGVRVSALGTGVFTWETLPLATIERIEIVRGPRASYWGSDAIGGVIQIFTRSLDGPRVAVGYGSYGDAKADVGVGHRGESGGFSVQLGARDEDGFPSQNENGFGYEDKDHGLRNRHLAARADQRWGEQRLEGALIRSQGTTEFAGGYSDFTEQAFNLALSGSVTPVWQHRLMLGGSSEDYATPAYFGAYESRRTSLGWQNEIALSREQHLVLGIESLHERGENRDNYKESRSNTGIYAGWQIGVGAFDSEVSLRSDHNSVFGNHSTGSVAAGWRFNDAARAYASHGQGFRGPTLNELYSPGFGGMFAGNPGLDPETSRSSEVGFEFIPGQDQHLKANFYETRIRNLISFSGIDFQAENVARARIKGAEFGYDRTVGAWRFDTAFTWQDPRNEDTDAQLLRRPRQKFSGSVERSFGETIRAGAELVRSGKRVDVGGIELPGYTLLNLRASWVLTPEWKLLARIENLTDKDYELAYGYNTPERSGFVEVVWSAH
ncbi:MAG: TonB-dependent receptor [Dokdonella sp.]|uniref:TonB-dependent receptor domain-containing protein n=1 Tax=Dokdonella sp. TaxID=2291710 RepID=UPI002B8E2E15|nr:TonB-dependent receptor [Dokdonella sp.]HOX70518.1 TonB-dependent receptor [Dokdonella sp.]HPG93355.1 TonB-dependent receptor [Dokdonella sp.]HPN78255.1 TonB-dependent receptor [Dokdonella sp.]